MKQMPSRGQDYSEQDLLKTSDAQSSTAQASAVQKQTRRAETFQEKILPRAATVQELRPEQVLPSSRHAWGQYPSP